MRRTDLADSSRDDIIVEVDTGSVVRLTLYIFLPVVVIAVVLAIYVLAVSERAEMKYYLSQQRHAVDMQATTISRDLHHISKELIILANQKELKKLWSSDGRIDQEILSGIEKDYLNIATHKDLYDQIRLLDESGNEVVRVNYNNGHPAIVPPEKLQNKKGRYYFDDAFDLDRGEIFVSPFDLNVERGKIELPLKPMIRFATPVFDRFGEKRGIVLLNYFGAQILDNFSRLSDNVRGHQIMLLNRDGYWLVGPNPNYEWGFMYENRKEFTFEKVFPGTWRKIISSNNSQFIADEGLITSEIVYPLPQDQKSTTGSGKAYEKSGKKLIASDYYWVIVYHIPKKILYAARNERRGLAISILALFGLVFMIGSLIISKSIVYRRQAESNRKRLIEELQDAMKKIKTLDGLIPICSHCKKIRDGKGYWNQIEQYIAQHSEAKFSHSICRECAKKHYPDIAVYDDNDT